MVVICLFIRRANLCAKCRTSSADVLPPLAQRRADDRKDVQTVEEIAPELPRFDHRRQITIGRRDQPYIDADRARAAEPLEFLLLQHAEEFRLQLEGNVTDFVEEQRSAVRELEAADLLRDGAGKCPFFVAEELALEQAGGNGGAVQLHERARRGARSGGESLER